MPLPISSSLLSEKYEVYLSDQEPRHAVSMRQRELRDFKVFDGPTSPYMIGGDGKFRRGDTFARKNHLGMIMDGCGRHSSRRAHFEMKRAECAVLIRPVFTDEELFPKHCSLIDIVKLKLQLTKSQGTKGF